MRTHIKKPQRRRKTFVRHPRRPAAVRPAKKIPPAYENPYAELFDPNIPTPHTDFLAGILAGMGYENMTREQIRDERLTNRYLK